MDDSGALADYLNSLRSIGVLPKEEEEKLSKMIRHGDAAALEKLVRHNLRFVVSTVKGSAALNYQKVPFEDLIAIGNEALVRAAKKWVPQNGARFATYAKNFILRGIRRSIDNEWTLIRVPVNVAEEIRRMQYTERKLSQKLGEPPTDSQIADQLKTHPGRVAELRRVVQMEPSFIGDTKQGQYQEESEE